MKKISLLFTGVLLAALCSCSSSNEPKEISPTSTDFTSGELAKLIEVVDEPCQLSYVEQDGAIATQFIKLKVKLRLTKESPKLKEVDARDINFTGLLSVATVILADENETKIQDLKVKSEELLKLKKLLQGDEGDEDTITFEEEFHNSEDAPKWFEQATAFTPYLTGDIVVGKEGTSFISSSFEIDGTHDMHGTVDKYPITMHLEIDGSTVKGMYYYDKQGSNAKLNLSGTNEDGVLDINETDAKGTPTGHFTGRFSNGIYSGSFVTNQGKQMPFKLTEGDPSDIEVDDDSYSDDYDSDSDVDMSSSSGSEDWDAVLESYEKYVDKYVSYVKKAAKGDMTALAEYPSLMEKAQEFSDKLQNAKGDMSASQWTRYNNISMKMMKAAQEMQQKYQKK